MQMVVRFYCTLVPCVTSFHQLSNLRRHKWVGSRFDLYSFYWSMTSTWSSRSSEKDAIWNDAKARSLQNSSPSYLNEKYKNFFSPKFYKITNIREIGTHSSPCDSRLGSALLKMMPECESYQFKTSYLAAISST